MVAVNRRRASAVVRWLRRERRTITWLARRAGLTRVTVSKYCNGHHVSAGTRALLERALASAPGQKGKILA